MAAPRSVKAEREQIRETLFARGCTATQVAMELVRRFGTRPRLAWRHALGWPQWKLVQEYLVANPEARLTESRVSEYESWPFGGVKPSMDYLAGLAVTFRCRIADLVDDADREHLTAAERLLVGELPAPAPPVVSPASLHEEWSARVTAAVADPARYCDAPVVAVLRTQLETFKAMDGRHGPAAALPGVLGVVSAVWAMAQEAPERMRILLLSLAAEAAEFAGWLYRDLADPKRAGVWYDRAMEWAQAAGDRGAQGFLLVRKSQMAYDARDGHRVLMLARTALDETWNLDPWLRAEALLQAAKGQTMTGQTVHLSAVTDQAYALAAGRERMLDLRVATAWSEVGEPERAAELYAGVLSSGELSRRDIGFFTARRSAALAQTGEPEEAAVQAIEALGAAREIGSARTGVIVRDTLTALRRWSTVPVVADLEAAVSSRR